MSNFPEIMIVRYYESWIIEVTYSDDWSGKNRSLIENRLQKQQEEDKHLETYQIYFKWEDIWNYIRNEEEREEWEIEWNKKNI